MAVQKVANELGISQNVPHGPAIYIGSFETDLKRSHCRVFYFSQRWSAKASLHHRAIDNQQQQTDLSRRPHHETSLGPWRGLDDVRG